MRTTDIPGLLVLDLAVHGDSRGWFKENWQREKMTALGLPDFGPVQNNVAFNAARGATRGIHAEPWDKLVSVGSGQIFAAWVDLRDGETFGRVVTLEIGPETAVFVPRGVGNAYQTLTDEVVYSYLVNDHWSAAARESYTFLNLADESVAIDWPVPLTDAEISAADRAHPRIAEVQPFAPRRTLVVGASGQLGTALAATLEEADVRGRPELDLTEPTSLDTIRWSDYDVVVNAAAHTAVDAAETPQGRRGAWALNVGGVAALTERVRRSGGILVHVSSDYVFDGTRAEHAEDEPFSPLGVYGQTKAAADGIVATLPRHYVVRTSWVVGAGANFVRTMASLADRGASPDVIDDQHGRLTFADDLARGIHHLVTTGAPFGTYNLTGGGEPTTWAEVARRVFVARGRSADDVNPVTTEDYLADKHGVAPRPRSSTLNLAKIRSVGFEPGDVWSDLMTYLERVPPPES